MIREKNEKILDRIFKATKSLQVAIGTEEEDIMREFKILIEEDFIALIKDMLEAVELYEKGWFNIEDIDTEEADIIWEEAQKAVEEDTENMTAEAFLYDFEEEEDRVYCLKKDYEGLEYAMLMFSMIEDMLYIGNNEEGLYETAIQKFQEVKRGVKLIEEAFYNIKEEEGFIF